MRFMLIVIQQILKPKHYLQKYYNTLIDLTQLEPLALLVVSLIVLQKIKNYIQGEHMTSALLHS